MPPRAATELPKGMYARNGPPIGLPATPKAMRLIMESVNSGRAGRDAAKLPPVPVTFAQRHSPNTSPDKERGTEPLTLLPSTVYQPPASQPVIHRRMSAPIPHEPGPARYARKASTGEIRSIDEIVGGERRHSHEEQVPPPPLPHARLSQNQDAVGSGMIEIILDDDNNAPIAAAPNDGNVPVIATPATPPRGHNRGRSSGDNSFSGRLSKATEHLRSASRGRKDAGRSVKSSSMEGPRTSNHQLRSPVEHDADVARPGVDAKGSRVPTRLHHSEMI